jgi:hypothetical protein
MFNLMGGVPGGVGCVCCKCYSIVVVLHSYITQLYRVDKMEVLYWNMEYLDKVKVYCIQEGVL